MHRDETSVPSTVPALTVFLKENPICIALFCSSLRSSGIAAIAGAHLAACSSSTTTTTTGDDGGGGDSATGNDSTTGTDGGGDDSATGTDGGGDDSATGTDGGGDDSATGTDGGGDDSATGADGAGDDSATGGDSGCVISADGHERTSNDSLSASISVAGGTAKVTWTRPKLFASALRHVGRADGHAGERDVRARPEDLA